MSLYDDSAHESVYRFAHKVISHLPSYRARIIREIDDENLKAVEEISTEWHILMNLVPEFLIPDVCLIQPLAMAVQREKVSVVEYLVRHCHQRIDALHEPSCDCPRCVQLQKSELFLRRYTKFFIDSASSPCYFFSHDSQIVIDRCLLFSRNFRFMEHLLQTKQVEHIRNRVEDIIIRTLDCCVHEKETLHLVYDPTGSGYYEKLLGKIFDFIDFEMKRVVEHSTLQIAVKHASYTDNQRISHQLRELERHNHILMFLIAAACYLFLIPATVFVPSKRLIQVIKVPHIRLLMDSLTFWIFLVFAIFASIESYTNIFFVCTGMHQSEEFYRALLLQLAFACMIVSKMIRFCTCIYFTGKYIFLNIYDVLHFISIYSYFLGVSLILISLYVIPKRPEIQAYCRQTVLKVENITLLGSDCPHTRVIYEDNPDLLATITAIKEPYIIGILFYACGHLLYCISVGHCTYVKKDLAMFTIAVQRMIASILKWGFMTSLFVLGFALAFSVLYNSFKCSNPHFSSISGSLRQIFWTLFGMSGTTDYELKAVYSMKVWTNNMVVLTGETLYLAIFVVGTLVLVNLMVALMAITYESVRSNRNTEVTFARTKQRLKYILWRDYLPLPFNLLYPVHLAICAVWTLSLNGWNVKGLTFGRKVVYRAKSELRRHEMEHLERKIAFIFQELKLSKK